MSIVKNTLEIEVGDIISHHGLELEVKESVCTKPCEFGEKVIVWKCSVIKDELNVPNWAFADGVKRSVVELQGNKNATWSIIK